MKSEFSKINCSIIAPRCRYAGSAPAEALSRLFSPRSKPIPPSKSQPRAPDRSEPRSFPSTTRPSPPPTRANEVISRQFRTVVTSALKNQGVGKSCVEARVSRGGVFDAKSLVLTRLIRCRKPSLNTRQKHKQTRTLPIAEYP